MSSFFFALIFSFVAYGQTQTITELEAQLMANPNSAPIREQAARAYGKEKNWNKVIEVLNSHTDVVSPRGFLHLATAYQELNRPDEVVRVLSLLSDKRPRDPTVLYLMGDAKMKAASKMNDPLAKRKAEGEAISKFREALRLKPKFVVVHQSLLNYYLNVGMHHDAREQALDMLKIFGTKSEMLPVLCRLYAVDGFLPQAIEYCRRAMRTHKTSPESHMYLAQTYFDQKEMDKAESTLVQAARKFKNSEFAQYGAGQFFSNKGNFQVAVKYLTKAVGIDPNSPRSRAELAKALFEVGRFDAALPHYLKACQLNPAVQEDVLLAATKLRLKGVSPSLSQKYSQSAGVCAK